jgi:hypothetical protein
MSRNTHSRETIMNATIRILPIVILALFGSAVASADDNIHYIGFNKFGDDPKIDSSRLFDDYIVQLRPIMTRYGMTLEAYDVVHGGSEQLSADVLTFGSAPDQAAMQAFFSDPEFQEAFPMLVDAVSDHQVIFTAEAFAVDRQAAGHTLLSLNWVAGETANGVQQLQELNKRVSPLFEHYDVQQTGNAVGAMSSHGLAGEITTTTPPQLLEMWSMGDAHGFFDDPQVIAVHKEAAKLVSRSEAFWLQSREIR